MTLACATDDNHGLSVAAGAQLVGAQAAVFVRTHVSAARVSAMAARGARIIRVEGNYDDAVAEASWPGYERVPVLVMQGYTVLLREALEQLNTRPIHLLVQAGVGVGVGGLAAAVSTHLSCVWGEERPTLVIVEPRRAACLYESAAATADALRRLTYPLQRDPAIVARGSGGAGLAGLMTFTGNPDARGALGSGAVCILTIWLSQS